MKKEQTDIDALAKNECLRFKNTGIFDVLHEGSFIAGFKAGYQSKQVAGESDDGWISVEDRKPDLIEGQDYSENVLVIHRGKLAVMAYCWIDCDEDSGYAWCNCGNQIDGDPEFDDDYKVTHWRPLPKPPLFKEKK